MQFEVTYSALQRTLRNIVCARGAFPRGGSLLPELPPDAVVLDI